MKISQQYRPGRAVPKMQKWEVVAGKMTHYFNEALKQGGFKENIPLEVLRAAKTFFSDLKPVLPSPTNIPITLKWQGSTGLENYEIVRYLLALEHEEIFGRLHDLFKKMYEIGRSEYYEEVMARSHQGLPQ